MGIWLLYCQHLGKAAAISMGSFCLIFLSCYLKDEIAEKKKINIFQVAKSGLFICGLYKVSALSVVKNKYREI